MNDNLIINETLISRDNLELYKNETDKKIRNYVENKISENIDETLTKSGFSADSSVVGEKIDEINGSISTLGNEINQNKSEINQNKTDILNNQNDIKDLQTVTSLNAKVIFSFNLQRTGKVYTVRFPLWETSQTCNGEKLDDNEGLVCNPSTSVTRGISDYDDIPLFRTYDCNAYVDDNGVRHITAIKGDTNFKDVEKVDVFVLGMSYYEKWYEADGYVYYSRTDMPKEGYTLASECRTKDGTDQGFALYGKYIAGDIDGMPYSSKGRQDIVQADLKALKIYHTAEIFHISINVAVIIPERLCPKSST